MMTETNYVGVRYIGKKSLVNDSVNMTGAVWKGQGAVLNFTADLANKLAVHTDSFEVCDADPDAKSYDGKSVVASPKKDDFVVYLNVTKAEYEQYARNELFLQLVPKNIKEELQAKIDLLNTPVNQEVKTDPESATETVDTVDTPALADAQTDKDEQIPLSVAVEELYEKEDKTSLLALCRNFGLTVSNNISLDKLKQRALSEIPAAMSAAQ